MENIAHILYINNSDEINGNASKSCFYLDLNMLRSNINGNVVSSL